jgi:hypothetical protein
MICCTNRRDSICGLDVSKRGIPAESLSTTTSSCVRRSRSPPKMRFTAWIRPRDPGIVIFRFGLLYLIVSREDIFDHTQRLSIG